MKKLHDRYPELEKTKILFYEDIYNSIQRQKVAF